MKKRFKRVICDKCSNLEISIWINKAGYRKILVNGRNELFYTAKENF